MKRAIASSADCLPCWLPGRAADLKHTRAVRVRYYEASSAADGTRGFVPPKSEDAADTVEALKGTEDQFKDYTPNNTPAQIELQVVPVRVLNKMDAFAESVTSSTPL